MGHLFRKLRFEQMIDNGMTQSNKHMLRRKMRFCLVACDKLITVIPTTKEIAFQNENDDLSVCFLIMVQNGFPIDR